MFVQSTSIKFNEVIKQGPSPTQRGFTTENIVWILNQTTTGWLDWKLSKVNCSSSKTEHFWSHVVKTKMCLRTGSFILANPVFWVREIQKGRKWRQLSTCFCGLVDRVLDCYAKGPRFKTHLGQIRISFFYRNFIFFSTFWQNENSPYKTASPQTNFGLYNTGSEMHCSRGRAIYFWQLSI